MAKVTIRLDSVLRTSAVVSLFWVGAKLLNFFKKILIGKLFGVSWVADAFFAASYLPYYLAIFFEGILFLVFLPLFSKIAAERGEAEARQFTAEVFLFVFLVTSLLAALAWWQASWIVREIVPGFTSPKQELTLSLLRILCLVVVLLSLTSLFKVLNSYFGAYGVAASSGFVETVVMIGVTLISWKIWGVYGTAWGSVAGALTALVIQSSVLIWKRGILPAPRLFKDSRLRLFLYTLLPMMGIWGFQQVPLVILNRFGSGMWEGTISALTIAYALITVPMGLVSHTVLLAVFPSLAKQGNEANPEGAKTTFFQTLRGGFLLLIPLGFLLSAFARPLAALFFDGNGISHEGTRRIANTLTCFGWATFALYADVFMVQSLNAVRKSLPALLLCASRAVVTYLFTYFLSDWWDYQGLALSLSLALVVNLYLLFPLLFRLSPFQGEWGGLFLYSGKLILAASPIAFAGWLLSQGSIAQWLGLSKPLLILGLGSGFVMGIGAYLLFLSWLGVEEIRFVFQELRRTGLSKDWQLAESNE
jgi:putative peptidoglycan lipid II flippase